jgi:hypothetical protein
MYAGFDIWHQGRPDKMFRERRGSFAHFITRPYTAAVTVAVLMRPAIAENFTGA